MKEILLKDNKICILDNIDFIKLKDYKLYLSTGNYIKLIFNSKHIFLHRLLLNITNPKIIIDHINRNPLDNRRENLRIASRSQNAANRISEKGTSKYKGVCSFRTKWRAYISCLNYRSYHLGVFNTEVDAARAYDSAAKFFWKEFALLNFPNEIPSPFKLRKKIPKSSKYIGISFDLSRNKWKAYIDINNKRVWMARFNTEYEAHINRQNKLKEFKQSL